MILCAAFRGDNIKVLKITDNTLLFLKYITHHVQTGCEISNHQALEVRKKHCWVGSCLQYLEIPLINIIFVVDIFTQTDYI